ncbi:MAG: hypothetical protein LBR07_04155 [Puniceicoccales bacterium]|nr:hypothetical protein [Puniceicoccales bacterium]
MPKTFSRRRRDRRIFSIGNSAFIVGANFSDNHHTLQTGVQITCLRLVRFITSGGGGTGELRSDRVNLIRERGVFFEMRGVSFLFF